MVILVTEFGRARFCRFIAMLGVVGIASCGGDAGAGGYADTDAPNETDGQTTLARGISIEEIELNQGTRIPIGFAGDWVDGPDRLGFVIASRDSLLRVHYSVDDDWEPREIEARLTLMSADETKTVATQVAMVEHSSEPDTLDGTFWFELRDELGQTEAGTEYQVELWETVAGAGAELDEGVAVNPSDGPEPIGFEQVAMQIKVVLVPIEYDGQVPELSDEIQRQLVDNLYEQNPVTEVVWDVHSPVVFDDNLSSLASLLPVMSQLRTAEAVAPNVYYHALVDVNGSGVNMVAGIANLANSSMGDSDRRVAATVYYKHYDPGDEETGEEPQTFPPTGSSRTWVHELGHNQGLSHVYCPGGNSAGDDPSYPYEDGKIGVHGFGIRDFHMYTPSASHDYMSYCGNSWVSDWTWNRTFLRIQTLTSWDYAGPPAGEPETTQILVGMLFADGSEDWWVYDAAAPSAPGGSQALEYWRDGELVATQYAEVSMLSDEQTVVVTAPLPAQGLELDAITRVDEHGVRRELELERVHVGRDFAQAASVHAK